MTILNTDSFIEYTGDGVRRLFTYNFADVPFALYGGFVDGVAVGFTGQVNGIRFDVAPPLGSEVFIFRLTPLQQDKDWRPYGPFQADKTEGALDQLIALKQEAVDFRSAFNIVTILNPEYVEIGQDKGEHVFLNLWQNQNAGVFAGRVATQIPRDGTFTGAPQGFLWMRYDNSETVIPVRIEQPLGIKVTAYLKENIVGGPA